jgi:hypothetical protein
LFYLLDLLPLTLDLLVLLLDLGLRLRLLSLLILELIADSEATQAADCAANGRACAWRSHCRSDYRSGTRTYHRADPGTFLSRGERLA